MNSYLQNSGGDFTTKLISHLSDITAQSAGAVEYTDCFSAVGWDSHDECPGYDTKQSDGEAPAF